MKVVRFLKRVGITAIPILAVVILMLCFNIASILSFNAVHPDKLSRDLFANNMFNTYWILISIGTSLGVFFKLRNWKKAKIRQMNAEESEADEHKEGDEGEHTNNARFKPIFKVSYQIQDWYHVRRYLISEVLMLDVYGTLHLDIPKQHEKENDPFWKDCDAFLWALFVDGIVRNNGLAKKMMREAETLCLMSGCRTVGLRWDDRESEPWVLDWYKRIGYEEIRVEEDGHAHFLVKDLNNKDDSGSSSDSDKKDDATEE